MSKEFVDSIRKISKDRKWLDDYFDFLNGFLLDLMICTYSPNQI